MKFPYQRYEIVSPPLILLDVHESYIDEVRKTEYMIIYTAFITITFFGIDRGLRSSKF